MHNRLVNTSGKRVEEMVLLDENLLKCKSVNSNLLLSTLHTGVLVTIYVY